MSKIHFVHEKDYVYYVLNFENGAKDIFDTIYQFVKLINLPIVDGEVRERPKDTAIDVDGEVREIAKDTAINAKNYSAILQSFREKYGHNKDFHSGDRFIIIFKMNNHKIRANFYLSDLPPNKEGQLIIMGIGDSWKSINSRDKKRFNEMFNKIKTTFSLKVFDFEHSIPADENGLL